MDVIGMIVSIIENPMAEKVYRDLKKHYENNKLSNEAQAIGDLIEKRFGKNNNTPSSEG